MPACKMPLAKLDPTLVEASQTAASKAHYQLDRLRERAMAAELRRSEVVARKAEVLNQALYPEDGLQERGVAGVYYVARYGTGTSEGASTTRCEPIVLTIRSWSCKQ